MDVLELVKDRLVAKLGAEAVLVAEMRYDYPVFQLQKTAVHEALRFLKEDPDLGFHFLTTMCGIHLPDTPEMEMGLMYQLHNMPNNWRIRIHTYMTKDDVTMPTITDIYKAANWMERETFDFFGFKFIGHPDLRRIANMDEMNYHPLLKQYPLEDAGRDDKQDKYFGR